MSIQINIVIWTVINFCLLMLVLHFMLFKPLLSFMDKRNEKIENIKQKNEEAKKLREEGLKAVEAENEAREAEYKNSLAVALEQEKQRINSAAETADAEYETALLQKQSDVENECKEISETVNSDIDKIAEAFAEKLVTARY